MSTIYDLPGIVGKKPRESKKKERDGIEIDKGAKLFPEKIDRNIEFYQQYWEYFTNYPDLFIDLIIPSYSRFQLYFYQRIF